MSFPLGWLSDRSAHAGTSVECLYTANSYLKKRWDPRKSVLDRIPKKCIVATHFERPLLPWPPMLSGRASHLSLNEIVPPEFAQVSVSSVQATPFEVCWLEQQPPYGLPPPSVPPSGSNVAEAGLVLCPERRTNTCSEGKVDYPQSGWSFVVVPPSLGRPPRGLVDTSTPQERTSRHLWTIVAVSTSLLSPSKGALRRVPP